MTNHAFRTLLRSEISGAEEPQRKAQADSPVELAGSVLSDRLRPEQAAPLYPPLDPRARLVALTESASLGAEMFMQLAARLHKLQDQRQLKKVVVTSSVTNEGKSLLAANLAISLARIAKQKVLLLEGDLRQPALTRLFGCAQRQGLTEALYGKGSTTRLLYRMDTLPLYLFFAGALRDHPSQLLQSPQLPPLLAQLEECFDWIVIDAPPVLPLADANLWVQLSDGVLLVVRDNWTPKKILQKALDNLDKRTLLGLVLNEASGLDRSYSKGYPGQVASKDR